MKALFIGIIALVSIHLNAQDMIHPTEIVTKLFVSTDQQDWKSVQETFSSTVHLDYSSMSGNPAANLNSKDIISSWKSVLPGFEFTHHQIGNFITTQESDKAHVFCYGTASHYLQDEQGSVWTVIGSYDFDLKQNSEGQWEITSMTFHYKFQDGNPSLVQKAIQSLK